MYKHLSKIKFSQLSKIWFYCALTLLFILSKNSFARSAETDTIKLQLKWRNQFQFAGYYAAKIKGYYAENGLNVKILAGGPHISPINNVINGKADIGVFDPDILSKEFQNKKLMVLATIMQSSGYCIISAKSKNILRPADLVGKNVLISDSQGWGIFKAILLKEGIDPSKIHTNERLKDSEDISKDSVDAVITYIASQPQRLEALGYKFNIIRPEEYGVDFYGDILFTTKQFANKDTKKTEAFIQASIKGWKYALQHERELIDYILTLPDVKAYGTTRENFQYEAKEIRKLIKPDLIEVGHTNLGRWEYMLKLFQELGVADKYFNLKNFVYSTEEAEQNRWYLPIAYGFIIVLVIITFVFLINLQLRLKIKRSTTKLLQEIEHRKNAEQLANENKEQIELILNSSNIGLWELDVDTKNATFNQQFKKVLGYKNDLDFSFEEFIDKIHPEDLKLAEPLFDTSIENRASQKMVQFRINNANGQYVYFLASSKLLFKNEQAVKISGVILSIEELKKKELEILDVTQELIRRNNELKKFAYITSHNLRAPVVNITSLSEMIDDKLMDGENLEIVDKMRSAIHNLNTTLNDLIEVVAHDKSELVSLEKIDIEETIQAIIDAIKTESHQFDVNIIMDINANELLFPKHCFVSIVLNLLTNAIKFSKKGERTIINIETHQDSNYTVLKFTDNGIGIDLSKNESKIFGLYQRLNHNIEGKGIGLFIIKSHMDTFNGKIEIESKLNEGTTFTLYFPRI